MLATRSDKHACPGPRFGPHAPQPWPRAVVRRHIEITTNRWRHTISARAIACRIAVAASTRLRGAADATHQLASTMARPHAPQRRHHAQSSCTNIQLAGTDGGSPARTPSCVSGAGRSSLWGGQRPAKSTCRTDMHIVGLTACGCHTPEYLVCVRRHPPDTPTIMRAGCCISPQGLATNTSSGMICQGARRAMAWRRTATPHLAPQAAIRAQPSHRWHPHAPPPPRAAPANAWGRRREAS